MHTTQSSEFKSIRKNGGNGSIEMDTELKGISVTREVEVASAYCEVMRAQGGVSLDNLSPHAYSFSSEKHLKYSGSQRNPDTPWLDDSSAPSSPRDSIDERSPV
jgi:hypothetical protein